MKTYLKNSVIYQVYVRNFTKEGTFNALKQKLDYIKNLKVDILYLLPISPIGKEGRKGDLGSPYSISDYTEINSELGTLEDFKSLSERDPNYLKVIKKSVAPFILRRVKQDVLKDLPNKYEVIVSCEMNEEQRKNI